MHRPVHCTVHRTAGVLLVALILGGCSVSVGNDRDTPTSAPTSAPTSLLHDDRLTLDLTRRPTRASFGLREDRNFRFYERSGPMIRTTVKLPTGTFTTPAFQVSGATTAGGGADDHTRGKHDPKYFDVLSVYDSGQQALAALREQADTLGIAGGDIDAVSSDLGTGATVPQSRVLRGFVKDWLSVEVTLSDTDPGNSSKDTGVQLDYEFDVDVYHNPAVDRIVHDGRVEVDLRSRPSREELGFLPGYTDADVDAEPGRTYTFAFTTPDGTVEVPSASMLSSTDGTSTTGAPEGTSLTSLGTPEQVRTRLLDQAAVLGLDRAAVEKAFRGGGQTTLEAAAAPHYRLQVRVDVDPARTDGFAGSIRYLLTYRG